MNVIILDMLGMNKLIATLCDFMLFCYNVMNVVNVVISIVMVIMNNDRAVVQQARVYGHFAML